MRTEILRARTKHRNWKSFLMECRWKTCQAAARRAKCLRSGLPYHPGAGEGIRTPDPLITNQMLYQLSYASSLGRHSPLRDKLNPLIPS